MMTMTARARSMLARGFTFIELVITVAIVAVLASITIPMHEMVARRAKEQELKRVLREIREAIDAYKQASDEGRIRKAAGASGYPKQLEELVEGIDDQRSVRKDKIYFLRKLHADPLSTDLQANAADTWLKRAYASPPDEPAEGDDVFDIHSRAPGKGSNGRPYRDW